MNKLQSKRSTLAGLAVAAIIGLTAAPGAFAADDYDMDCKVILCLAGGFPSGCGDAHSYMMKRLRKGKSPYGVCTYGGPEGTEAEYSDAQTKMGVEYHEDCAAGFNTFDFREDGMRYRKCTPQTPIWTASGCGRDEVCDGSYYAAERPKKHWIQVLIPEGEGSTYTSDRYWW